MAIKGLAPEMNTMLSTIPWDAVTSISAVTTTLIAAAGLGLAWKNLSFTADQHDRESVSLVFRQFELRQRSATTSYIIQNQSNVGLIINDVVPFLHQKDFGWIVAFYRFKEDSISGSITDRLYEWSDRGVNAQEYSTSVHSSLIIEPGQRLLVKNYSLISDDVEGNSLLATIKATLCYAGAKQRTYEMRLPEAAEIKRIMKAQIAESKALEKQR